MPDNRNISDKAVSSTHKVYYANHQDNQTKVGSVVVIKDSMSHFEKFHLEKAEIQLASAEIKSTSQNLNAGDILPT